MRNRPLSCSTFNLLSGDCMATCTYRAKSQQVYVDVLHYSLSNTFLRFGIISK